MVHQEEDLEENEEDVYQGREEDEVFSVPNSCPPFCVAQNRGALRVRPKTQGRAPGSSNGSAV